MYREAELAARNFYNISLLAGYAEGKSLSLNQKGNLFKAIHHRFGEGSRLYYSGNFKEWEPARKVDYYKPRAGRVALLARRGDRRRRRRSGAPTTSSTRLRIIVCSKNPLVPTAKRGEV
jgi:hypothetical protein